MDTLAEKIKAPDVDLPYFAVYQHHISSSEIFTHCCVNKHEIQK